MFPAEGPRVVPISDRVSFLPAKPVPARTKPAARKPVEKRTDQQKLAFIATGAVPSQRPKSEVRSEIFCTAPVAKPQHRAIAAAVDFGVIAAALSVAIAAFVFGTHGEFEMNWQLGGAFAILSLLVAGFYQALWVLANGDSAGLRWARLKVIDFDGRRPARRKRGVRLAATWLSVLPAGLGLFWALMDEEALTWHDQISKTFPSPEDAPFERR